MRATVLPIERILVAAIVRVILWTAGEETAGVGTKGAVGN
jgi:hypothetical protein